jgi:hypothetical protein
MADEPTTGLNPRENPEDEDDTEGHQMLQNMGLSRPLAQARERDIQQHLKRHELENDARAHKKDRR